MEFIKIKTFKNLLGGLQLPKRKIKLLSVAFNTQQSSNFFNLVTSFVKDFWECTLNIYVCSICELYAFSHVVVY